MTFPRLNSSKNIFIVRPWFDDIEKPESYFPNKFEPKFSISQSFQKYSRYRKSLYS